MGLLQLDFIDYRTELDAPVEEVFAFFQQVERWPSWTGGIKRAFRKSDGPWGVGFKLGFVPDFVPLPLKVKVIGYQEGRMIEWGIRTRVSTIVHRFEFEPIGKDRCSVRHIEYARGISAILMRPLRQRVEDFDRGMADDLRDAVRKGMHRA